MATNSVPDKRDHLVREEEEDEDDEEGVEEEALSLCDLPVTLINGKDQDKPRKQDTRFSDAQEGQEDDFDFNSWGGLFSKEEPEMCAADEVFFQGQILPLRHSFSSEPCLSTKGLQIQRDGNKQSNRCGSRSESMDHGSMSEFRSRSSSRSSSLRSQNSSSSTSSTTTAAPEVVSKPKIGNQFRTIPSPKPQLRQPSSVFSLGNQGRKSSSAWEIFRLGVVPAPEIGLQDLKVRNSANRSCVSRNSSSSSNNSTCNATKSSVKTMSNKGGHDGDKGNHVLKQFVGKGRGLLSGCSCSVDTVAQLDTVMIKGGGTNKSINKTESATHAMKEKVVAELKKQKKHNNNNNNRQKQAKKVMSRRRTFEWLKELHATHPEEEALLSNT